MNWEKIISERFHSSTRNQDRYSNILSLLGMSLGCFAMVISLSVMNGFEILVHKKLIDFGGDYRIYGLSDLSELKKIEGVKNVMPFMERRGVVETGSSGKVVTFKAVDENLFNTFYNLNIQGSQLKKNNVIIGSDLAIRLGKNIGDKLIIYSPIDQSFGIGIPHKKEFMISGLFTSKVLDYDDRFIFMTLKDGKNLFKRKKNIDGVEIRTSVEVFSDSFKNKIKKKLNKNLEIFSWKDLNRSLVDAMKIERIATMLILSLIFVVSGFHLASYLTLVSYQKIKELGILKVMGASNRSIVKIIIGYGLKKSIKGASYGIIFALIIVVIQNYFSIIKIPSQIYFVQALPMIISLFDVLLVTILSLTFIFLASFLTGFKISRLNIIKALKWNK